MPLKGNCLSLHKFWMAVESKGCMGIFPRRQNALAQIWMTPKGRGMLPLRGGPLPWLVAPDVYVGHFVPGWGQFATENSISGGGHFCHWTEAVCHGKQHKWGGGETFCHWMEAVCHRKQHNWGGGGILALDGGSVALNHLTNQQKKGGKPRGTHMVFGDVDIHGTVHNTSQETLALHGG